MSPPDSAGAATPALSVVMPCLNEVRTLAACITKAQRAMAEIGLPIAATVFAWWFSTGLILLLDGLRRETFRRSMAFATAFLLAALFGLWAVAEDTSVAGAYLGFLCGLAVWGWIELSFLTGLITGPRRTPALVLGAPVFGASVFGELVI